MAAYIIGGLQVFVGIGALPAGLLMIIDPSGSLVGMTIDILSQSPFSNFLVPGIVLFTVNGICNLVASFLCFKQSPNAGNIGLLLGIFLLAWLCIQILYLGPIHWLQVLYLIVAIAEMYFAWQLKHAV